jgi:hypothetical protein
VSRDKQSALDGVFQGKEVYLGQCVPGEGMCPGEGTCQETVINYS